MASSVIDQAVLARLNERGVAYCLIGAAALSARGYARFSADIDLLTLDRLVLQANFWSGIEPRPELREGDAHDPLVGVVRFPGEYPLDIVIGRGYAARWAVETADEVPGQPCRVATSLGIALNKLEAGGPIDLSDIVALAQQQRQLGGSAWIAEIPAHLPRLSPDARESWKRIEGDLMKL